MNQKLTDYGLEDKYLVLKLDDIETHLPQEGKVVLDYLTNYIVKGRMQEGKVPSHDYMVINLDELTKHQVAHIFRIIDGD